MPITLAATRAIGLFSALPAPGIPGRVYFAGDTGVTWYDTGTAWVNQTAPLVSQIQQQNFNYAADEGIANAYVALLNPLPTLVAGLTVAFKASNANTGPSTLSVSDGGPAIPIKKQGTVALAGGEIAAGQIIRVTYDGVNFQM